MIYVINRSIRCYRSIEAREFSFDLDEGIRGRIQGRLFPEVKIDATELLHEDTLRYN